MSVAKIKLTIEQVMADLTVMDCNVCFDVLLHILGQNDP